VAVWFWPQIAALIEYVRMSCGRGQSLTMLGVSAACVGMQVPLATRAFASKGRAEAVGWLGLAATAATVGQAFLGPRFGAGFAANAVATTAYGTIVVFACLRHARADTHESADRALLSGAACVMAAAPLLGGLVLEHPTDASELELTVGVPSLAAIVAALRLALRDRWLARVRQGRQPTWRIAASDRFAKDETAGLPAITDEADGVLTRVAASESAYRDNERPDPIARVREVVAVRPAAVTAVEALAVALASTTWPLTLGFALLSEPTSALGPRVTQGAYLLAALAGAAGYWIARRASDATTRWPCVAVGAALAIPVSAITISLANRAVELGSDVIANGIWLPVALTIGAVLGLTLSPIILSAKRGLSPERSVGVACVTTAAHSFAGVWLAALVDAPTTYPAIVSAVSVAIAGIGFLDAHRRRRRDGSLLP
jgi:hypothetical protein